MNRFNDSVIKDCISRNISNLNTFFVFPTQICASMWADKTLEFSGKQCVALERFIAWDEFKGNSIRSQHQDKNSIPSTMRSVFAENLVLKNSRNPFLKNLIVKEYSENATGFSSWIAQMLPSLSMWKNSFDKKAIEPDEEDEDFLLIYQMYKKFLDDNNLFDPAWEMPPFKSDGNKYFIFFPEILMDYSEYKNILESSGDIEIISIPEEAKKQVVPDGHFYSNTRNEIKDVVYYLWKIHNEKNIPWNKIAVSVPDPDTYGPYLERDFSIYEIPYVFKNGKPLSSSGIGSLFSQIQSCCSENFSFDSVKQLLLNKELPWKDFKLNDQLIQFGRDNNCLCSYDYDGSKIDVWQESFSHPVNYKNVKELREFYNDLKYNVTKLAGSESFAAVRTNYFLFRDRFFDFSEGKFPDENEKILSRCISELGGLIDLEESFKENGVFEISSVYGFFCRYLEDKKYVPQRKSAGVQILPYRTAACAPFDVHVIVDGSQSGLSVVYKQLSFLRDDKRLKLGFTDDSNITQNFILLYAMNAQTDFLFTCSEKNIEGYSFTNSYLNQIDHRSDKVEDFAEKDSYSAERKSYLNKDTAAFPNEIFRSEKEGFDKWKGMSDKTCMLTDEIQNINLTDSHKKLYEDEKVKVSVTDLKRFYTCPRSLLFKKVSCLQQMQNAATLVDQYAMGNVNHLILELFFKELQNRNLSFEYDSENNRMADTHFSLLLECVHNGIVQAGYSHLSTQLFLTAEKAVQDAIAGCVTGLFSRFNGYKVYKVEETYELPDADSRYFIKSIVDCMLSSPDGEVVMIDFKTTSNSIPKNLFWDGTDENCPDFQLPVYKYVLENQQKPVKISACCFYSIRDCELKTVYSEIEELPVKDDVNEKFLKTQDVCLKLVDKYVNYVRENNFSPEIVDVDFSVCSQCDYKSVCRRSFAVSPDKE